MNNIIQSIQQDILSPDVSLASILLKAKVLAYQLRNDEFKQWIKNELDGYDSIDLLPDYRKLKAESVGTFSNGVYTHNNQAIQMSMVPDELVEYVGHVWLTEGIRAIEEMAQQKQLDAPWPGDWLGWFNSANRGRLNTYQLVGARRPMLGSTFAQILQTVRSRLQDFILEISDLPWNMEKEPPPAEQIERLFQITINNNAQGGNVSTFDQRGQQVQYQYNAAGNINIGAIQNQTDFVQELQKLKAEVAKAGEAQALDEDIVIDAEYEITKAIQEVKKPEPEKVTVLEHISKAKTLVEGTVATAGLATALMKLIEAAQKLL